MLNQRGDDWGRCQEVMVRRHRPSRSSCPYILHAFDKHLLCVCVPASTLSGKFSSGLKMSHL